MLRGQDSPARFMRVMVLLLNLVMDTLLFLWHFFCGFLLIEVSLSWLCWIVCWQVSTIYPICTLPDIMVSWEVCMLVFSPLVSPCPTPPNVQFRYPEVHYRQLICRDFLLICVGVFFPNNKISFLPFPPQ